MAASSWFHDAIQGATDPLTGGSKTSQPGAAPATAFAPPASPYSSGPGLQPGQAQPQLSSLNNADPTRIAQYYDNNKNVWQSPTFGEVNNQGLVSEYSDPNNRPAVSNNSQDWFAQYAGSMPNIDTDPGLDPYYNNAEKRSTEAINQAVAARGAYGSSAANDQISRGITDLEADKAKNEANYNLARLGEQRQWQGLGGQLAGQSDNNSLQRNQEEQQWAQLLSRLGIDASQLGLQRTNAGADAASNATGAERTRGRDYMSDEMGAGDRLSQLMTSILLPGLDNDAAMFNDESSGGIAGANAGVANENVNAQNTLGYGKDALAAYSALTKP